MTDPTPIKPPQGGSANPRPANIRTAVLCLPGNHVLLVRAPAEIDLVAVMKQARQDLKDNQVYFVLPTGVYTELVRGQS